MIFLLPTLLVCQEWIHNYTGYWFEKGNCLIETDSHDILITGRVSTPDSGSQIVLLNLDANGEEKWVMEYGFYAADEGHDLLITEDGLIIYGTGYFNSKPGLMLVKTNHSGVTSWIRGFPDFSQNIENSIVQDNAGNIYLSANLSLSDSPYLLKLNSQGETIWIKSYPDSTFDLSNGQQLFLTEYGDILYTIERMNNATEYTSKEVLKIDTAGTKLGSFQIPTNLTNFDNKKAFAVYDGHGIITLAGIEDNNQEKRIVKVDMTDQSIIWNKLIPFQYNTLEDIIRTINGNYIILTNDNSPSNLTDGLLLFGKNGEFISQLSFEIENLFPKSIIQSSDGDLIITGYTDSEENQFDIITFKIGIDKLTSNKSSFQNNNSIIVHPNPAKDYLFIKNENNFNVTISLYSTSGHKLTSKQILPLSNSKINLNDVAKGNYILQVCRDAMIIDIKKIIVL